MENDIIVEDDKLLGQYIPIHYHFQMLDDEARLRGFKSALDYLVPAGGVVLDLGAGTGVLSFFAAQKAAKVYSVERQAELVHKSQELLLRNDHGNRVELVLGDASTYLPPEPVDVVVCEMLHSALLREKQVEIIQAFKTRYRKKYGNELPIFIPDATILAVEPIFADFSFLGYQAPISLFEPVASPSPRFLSLGTPELYHILQYQTDFPLEFSFDGKLTTDKTGHFNALRFITKNILAIDIKEQTTIDFMNQNLILPISNPMDVLKNEQFEIRFSYLAGDTIPSLENSIKVSRT